MRNWAVRLASLALVGLVLFQSAAYADNIEGRVASVRPGALEVTVYDPQGRPYPNNLELRTDYRTYVSGVSSLSQLQANDAVSVEVTQEESGLWHADEVDLFQEVNVQPATQNPPPSMRSFLGNPVVRGALLGAVTGAIASSSSGGKAGKGALTGAGVGAAAGLLGSLFGGNDDSN